MRSFIVSIAWVCFLVVGCGDDSATSPQGSGGRSPSCVPGDECAPGGEAGQAGAPGSPGQAGAPGASGAS